MHTCYYISRVFDCFPRQTSGQRRLHVGRHHLYLCSILVSERAHSFDVPLQNSAGTMFSVFMMPQTSRHVAVLQIWCTTVDSGCDHVANPVFAMVSLTPEVTCKAITLPRLSPYKSYTTWYHAKAIQQVAKRSMCWSIWRPGDFQGNLFSRLCI